MGYAMYSSVGRLVFGFAGGYVQEEGIASGSRYFLYDLLQRMHGFANLPPAAFLIFSALCFIPLVAWCWRVNQQPGPAFLRPAAALAFTLMLLFSPHYPWYVIWLVPFLVLVPSLPMGVYVTGIFYGLTTQWSEPGSKLFFLEKCIYAAAFTAFVLQWVYQRWVSPLRLPARLFPVTEEAGQ